MNELFVIKKDYGFLHFCNTYFKRTEDILKIRYTRTYVDPETHTEREFPILDIKVTKDDIVKRNDFKDASEYGIFMRMVSTGDIARLMQNFIFAEEQKWSLSEVITMVNKYSKYLSQAQITYSYVVNTTCATQAQKIDIGELHTITSGIRLVYFTVPFTSDFDFLNTPIVLSNPATCRKLSCLEDYTEIAKGDGILTSEMMGSLTGKYAITPSIKLSLSNAEELKSTQKTITDDSPIEITAQLINKYTGEPICKSTEIHLENINGYLPCNRVQTDATTGKAIFKVIPLHMSKGDTIRVKAGFFYYSGIDEVTIELV